MSDIETTTVSEEGFRHTSAFGDYDLVVDAVGDAGPRAREALVATYASCFQGACRVGGQQRGHDDLGKLRIDASADVDEDDHLEGIRFEFEVEADLDDEALDEILARARDLCHVNNALRDELRAEVEIQGDAF